MRNTVNFFRKNQRVLAVSLLLASIYSCQKGVMEPPAETTADNTLTNTISANAIGNLLFHENADGSNLLTTSLSIQTSTSYGITASKARYYNGSKSIRFELRDTDPLIKSGTRAEISFPDCTNLNRWYSFALFAPSAQYKTDADDEVISQWHQGGGTSPALSLRVKNDRLYLIVFSTWIDLGVFDKDDWHAYVLHVKHSSSSDGLIEIWRDGEKIMKRSGSNMHKVSGDFKAPNWKFGLYKSDWNRSDKGYSTTSIRVLHFDDVKMGNENASYNDMVPVPSKTAPSDASSTTPTSNQGIVTFVLVNPDTEKDVLTISNGQTISLKALKLSKVNIRVGTTSSQPGSVKFQLSGKQTKTYTDNKVPFALHGDNGSGNYYYGNWNPPALGTYTLKATPYTSDNATGTAGASKTVTFTIAK